MSERLGRRFNNPISEEVDLGLHLADIAVLVVYFVAITLVGVWAARRIKSSSDFFMPRRFGKVMMIMFAFGSGTHSDQAVSVASKSYTNGLSGIWLQWLWLPVTPFYWLIAPVFRRFRAITTAHVFEARFSPSVGVLYAVVGILSLMCNIGIMLKGSSAVLASCTGGLITPHYAIGAMTVIFVIYGVAGGLSAAIVTDFIQGALTIVFSFLLLPLIMNAIGGFDGLRQGLDDPQMLSLVAPAEIGFFYVIVIAFNGLVGIVTQPHTMANCAAGKTEIEGRVGFMGGTLIKRICTIPWCFTGLAAVVYFAGKNMEPDQVFGAVAGDFLPRLLPGLLGVFIAAVVASVMSSCDVFMVSSSALFTEDVYKRFRPRAPDSHYVTVGRCASVVVVSGGIAFAYWLPGVVKGLEIFWKITPMMGIAYWLGLFWRRATTAGAWASTLTAFAIWWLTTQDFFISFVESLPCAEGARFVLEKSEGAEIYLPWQMIFYLAGGTVAGIVASLLTRPEPLEKTERFYALTRTPVQPDETVTAPCTLPEGAHVPERRTLFPGTQFEIPRPSLLSMTGFLAGWIFVAAIIYTVYLIAGL